MLQVKVKAVTLDQVGSFLVLLCDEDETKVLPISIGPFEAQSIALVLQGKTPPRPLTHDLVKTLCEQLGGVVEKIIITDIMDSTFYAEIYIQHNEQVLTVDSRPSDAIALALRCEAPIYMAPRLIEFTYDYEDIISSDRTDEELH
ncbi:MAG: bifunctional nuclease family protein [Firmicutes bacterium]|nr:bifunctional nuclease family protein [Bacillota bacterium]